jgi:uncharacterized cupin superfamily protein
LPAREVILILEGAARIEIEGAETLDLVQGSIASMPKGAVTTWHITTRFASCGAERGVILRHTADVFVTSVTPV